MARKQAAQSKSKGGAPPPLPHRDCLERANFVVQASIFLEQLGRNQAESSAKRSSAGRVEQDRLDNDTRPEAGSEQYNAGPSKRSQPADFAGLAHANIKAMRHWTQHNQVKIDPSLKRTLCKKCSTVLVPGLTSRVRIRHSKTHFNTMVHTCLTCSTTLSIPAPPSAEAEPGIDGPRRAVKRKKVRRPAAFHEREWPGEETVPEAGRSMECVEGGEILESVGNGSGNGNANGNGNGDCYANGNGAGNGGATKDEAVDAKPNGRGKSKGEGKAKAKQKGKPAAVDAAPGEVSDGHVLWAGSERVSGWGAVSG